MYEYIQGGFEAMHWYVVLLVGLKVGAKANQDANPNECLGFAVLRSKLQASV